MARKVKITLLLVACGLAIAGSVLFLTYTIGTAFITANDVCRAVKSVNHELLSVLQGQSGRIGAKDTPTYQFYLNHPAAAMKAQQFYDQFLKQLQHPTGC